MIRYRQKSHLHCITFDSEFFMHMVRMKCFQTSFVAACLSTLLGVCMKMVQVYWVPFRTFVQHSVNASGYSAFIWVLGTLLVFRTSQSYARFWEGTTLVHQMMGHWTDMTHVTIGFTRYSSAGTERIRLFKQTFVRLVSLLNAMILADLEGVEDGSQNALHFELLDIEAFEDDALSHIELTPTLVETPLLVFQWLNNLIVDEISTGVLNIPAPLLTRVFQAMNAAMLSYHDAKKYANTPFPFPYTAAIEMMMFTHFFITPLVMSSWTTSHAGLVIFTFSLVFLMWVLHLVPGELENPFQVSVNGLDTESLQAVMNQTLTALIGLPMEYGPKLKKGITSQECHDRLASPAGVGMARVAYPTVTHMKSYKDVFLRNVRHTRHILKSSTRGDSVESALSSGVLSRSGVSSVGTASGPPEVSDSDPPKLRRGMSEPFDRTWSRNRRRNDAFKLKLAAETTPKVTFLDSDGRKLFRSNTHEGSYSVKEVDQDSIATPRALIPMERSSLQLEPTQPSCFVLQGTPPQAETAVTVGKSSFDEIEPLPTTPRRTASMSTCGTVGDKARVLHHAFLIP